MDANRQQQLLNQYNPTLILLPEEPRTRRRPRARFEGPTGRGDYHPRRVEHFLREARLWKYSKSLVIRVAFAMTPRWLWGPHDASRISGYGPIRDAVREEGAKSDRWELDLVGTSLVLWSGWSYYANDFVRLEDRFGIDPHDRVVYGRVTEGDGGRIALSYWYFYIYNEAPLSHEGDWEAVWIELNDRDEPEWVVASGHGDGSIRHWTDASLRKTEDDHPIVYVARGTHAGYFEHKSRGHRRFVAKVLPLPTDRTVGDPAHDGCITPDAQGEQQRPELVQIPIDPDPDDPSFWWLSFRGYWGSAKLRLPLFTMFGMGVAPQGPAMKGDGKWTNPTAWIEKVRQAHGL